MCCNFHNFECCPHVASIPQFTPFMTTLSTFLVDRKVSVMKMRLGGGKRQRQKHKNFAIAHLSSTFCVSLFFLHLQVPTCHSNFALSVAEGGGIATSSFKAKNNVQPSSPSTNHAQFASHHISCNVLRQVD
jgi:hypothetical protein